MFGSILGLEGMRLKERENETVYEYTNKSSYLHIYGFYLLNK